MNPTILVTGGLGYVGSHFTRVAHDAGLRVVVLDDFSGGKPQSPPPGVRIVRGDIADSNLVSRIIAEQEPQAVVHFAGKIQVGESITRPAYYFEHNVIKTLALLDVVLEQGPKVFVFSSTAAVYGTPDLMPITEDAPCRPESAYGATKLSIEHALSAYGRAHDLRWAALRYFNAAGAHPDGTLCESHEPETHLIPLAVDAALGSGTALTVFGDDYATRDGTCVRDYVHVCDLADAHLAALERLHKGTDVGIVNLGSQTGFTVKEVIASCSRIIGVPVPHVFGARRPGDAATLVASAERAKRVLGWTPVRTDIDQIVEDVVRSRRPTQLR